MIIDCAHYQDGRRTDEKGVPLQEVAARRTERQLRHRRTRGAASPAVHVAAQVAQGPHRLNGPGITRPRTRYDDRGIRERNR